jgi:hypothetical protein
MNAWVTHGQLIDYAEEFFIHKVSKSSFSRTSQSFHVTFEAEPVDSLKIEENLSEIEEWNNLYTLQLAMLPEYIPSSLGEKILFIGKAVNILQSGQREDDNDDVFNSAKEHRIGIHQIQLFTKAFSKLTLMKEFNLPALEKVIEYIKEYVAYKLWQLVVIKSKLQDYLKLAKDFFLVAKVHFVILESI